MNGDQHFEEECRDNENKADMSFDVQLLTYEGNDKWVEKRDLKFEKMFRAKHAQNMHNPVMVPRFDPCEYHTFFETLNTGDITRHWLNF